MKYFQTYCLIFFLTFLLACNNNNKTETNNNQSDSTSLRLDSTQTKKKNTPEQKYFGTYSGKTIVATEMCPQLRLAPPDSFTMNVNLCEGTGIIKGTFCVHDSALKFVVTSKDFQGFCGDSQKEFMMSSTSGKDLIYRGVQIGCYPRINDLFRKTKPSND